MKKLILSSLVFVVLGTTLGCSSAPSRQEPSGPTVQFNTRENSNWHGGSQWFAEESWPNRWIEAELMLTAHITLGEIKILGGCMKAPGVNVRSITLVSLDSGKSFREGSPFFAGACPKGFAADGALVAAPHEWQTEGGAYVGALHSSDYGVNWEKIESKANPQTRVGVGSTSILSLSLKKNLLTLVVEGSKRTGEFESRDLGRSLKWKRALPAKETEVLLAALQTSMAETEKLSRPFAKAWVDWQSGAISLTAPSENPVRQP